jgi:hypothetical protein
MEDLKQQVDDIAKEINIEPAKSLPDFIHGLILLLTTSSLARPDLFSSNEQEDNVKNTVREGIRFSIGNYVERESGFVIGLLTCIQKDGAAAKWCRQILQNLFGINAAQLRRFVKYHPLEGSSKLYDKFPVTRVKQRIGNLVKEMKTWNDKPNYLLVLNHATQMWLQYGIMGAPDAQAINF